MLRKLIVFAFTIAISMLWMSYPVYAATSNYNDLKPIPTNIDTVLNLTPGAFPQKLALPNKITDTAQRTSQFVKRCLWGKPIDGIDEIGCTLFKEGIRAGFLVTVCYAADGAATIAFPPAGTLVSACNYLGIAVASRKVIAN